ncbi:hypothetical protein ACFL2Q_09965 [Thermodesulfobacteriota bacterium]
MENVEVYKRFLSWLRESWGHLPDSAELMPMLQSAYTPQEADLLTGMPFSDKTIENWRNSNIWIPRNWPIRLTTWRAEGWYFERREARR